MSLPIQEAQKIARWFMGQIGHLNLDARIVGDMIIANRTDVMIDEIEVLAVGRIVKEYGQLSLIPGNREEIIEVNLLERWVKDIKERTGEIVVGEFRKIERGIGKNYQGMFSTYLHRLCYQDLQNFFKINLFIIEPLQMGAALALLNSKEIMAERLIEFIRLKKKSLINLRIHDHYSECKKGEKCPLILRTDTEEEFFRVLDLNFVPPSDRSWQRMIQEEKRALGMTEAARWG